ncbi:hypothetical protein SFRURICE_021007 [Spodoptera frugiperda]|nr:hypothetical protein SFRURICE_021007 [Spodoptera frugiperda]
MSVGMKLGLLKIGIIYCKSYAVDRSGAADYLAGLPGLQLEKQGYERGGFKPLTNYNQPEDILGFQVLQIVRPGFRIIKLRDA